MKQKELLQAMANELGITEDEVAGYVYPTLNIDWTTNDELTDDQMVKLITDLWEDQNKLRNRIVRLQEQLAAARKATN